MTFSTPRPLTECKIGRRSITVPQCELDNSEYEYFTDSRQDGQLEIKERNGGPPWTTTRSILITAPVLQELCAQCNFQNKN